MTSRCGGHHSPEVTYHEWQSCAHEAVLSQRGRVHIAQTPGIWLMAVKFDAMPFTTRRGDRMQGKTFVKEDRFGGALGEIPRADGIATTDALDRTPTRKGMRSDGTQC